LRSRSAGRIPNRTLVYATLSVLLAATYGLVSIGLGVALGSGSTDTITLVP